MVGIDRERVSAGLVTGRGLLTSLVLKGVACCRVLVASVVKAIAVTAVAVALGLVVLVVKLGDLRQRLRAHCGRG